MFGWSERLRYEADAIDDLIAGALSGSSGGSTAATWGDPYFDPNIGKYVQRDSRGNIKVLGDPVQQIPVGADVRDLNRDGLDDRTGYAVGVYPVSTSVSPTGFVYQGQPVWPDGSPYTGGSAQGGPNYEGTRVGPGGIYGYNPSTGRYELIPGSEKLGTAPSPATYSGGGGSGAASAYSSIATAQINAQSRLAQIEAEAAARAQAAQQEAELQKELIRLQQEFTAEQNRIANALAAAGQASQIEVANAQLRQQYEAQRTALIGQYRESLKDYDARAVWDAIRGAGSLQGAVGEGQSLLTDNANAGAAALLGALNRPFEPIPAYDPNRFMNTLGTPGAGTGGLSGGLGGAATGGTGGTTNEGGSSVSGGSGGATTFSSGGIDLLQVERDLRAQGVPEAELAQVMKEMQQGQRAVSEAQTSATYQQMGLGGLFLTYDENGNPTIRGEGQGGMHGLIARQDAGGAPWYSGVWQSVDPFAPNYKPPYEGYVIPGYTYDYNTMQLVKGSPQPTTGMAGAGGNFVPPTEPIPADHPLAGGLTGGITKPQDTVIPMLAGGGMARGAFITGDSLSGKPTGHEELVIAPGGAHVIPLGKMGAQKLLGTLPRYASGTNYRLSRIVSQSSAATNPAPTSTGGVYSNTQDVYSPTAETYDPYAWLANYQPPTYTPPVIPYSQPVQQPVAPTPTQQAPTPTQPTPVTGGSGTTSPSSTTNSPTQTQTPTAPTPVTSPSPAPPPAAAPAQPPVNPLDSVYTPEQQGLLDQVMAYRTGTADMNLGYSPWDVAFQGLTPFEQTLYYNNEAQKRGIPAELFRQDVAMRALAGVGGGLFGRVGY